MEEKSAASRHLERVLVGVVTLTALSLLAAVLAYWTWYWIAPKATARAPLAMEPAARVRVAHNFFGASRTVAETTSSTGIKLLGVVAASGGQRGYAMLKVEDRETMTVREGDEIAGGMRLEAVGTDHVVLDRNGTRQTVRWPGKK